ncbi:MAG: DUF6108 family protein [Muribaculaceae bacterium]
MAQSGLKVSKLFDGKYSKQSDAVVVYITGEALGGYDLTLYRSVSFTCEAAEAAEIEKWVVSDGTKAIDKETVLRGGSLRYGFFVLPPGSVNRYLFFVGKDTDKGDGKRKITVVYIEGDASQEQIKKLIK